MPQFKRVFAVLCLTALACFSGTAVVAEPTSVNIMVRAVDAKFIGSGVGGMNVVLHNAETGAVLDSGRLGGGTGDTEALMKTGQTRGQSPAGAETAGFTATLDIDRPTRVRASVTGPLDVAQSRQQIETSFWVVPGRDQTSPGVVLQLPGLIVAPVEVGRSADSLSVAADVTMICGCPITAEGLWPAEDFEVVAQLYLDGELAGETALDFTGTTNRFAGELARPEAGAAELVIYAYQTSTGNTGVHRQRLAGVE